jgi:hypothetical protein
MVNGTVARQFERTTGVPLATCSPRSVATALSRRQRYTRPPPPAATAGDVGVNEMLAEGSSSMVTSAVMYSCMAIYGSSKTTAGQQAHNK